MTNVVTEKIKGITKWIEAHPEVTEPNMAEFMDYLGLVSEQKGNEREKSYEAYTIMYSARFSNSKCPDRTGTAMWKLFRAAFHRVAKEDYMMDKAERILLKKLMSVGNYLHQGYEWNNEEEEELLKLAVAGYNGVFATECSEAMAEILNLSDKSTN